MNAETDDRPADQHGVAAYVMRDGEAYMNSAQQAHFRAILNAWRHELMQEVDRTMGHMKIESGHCPDPNDRATQESDLDLELRTRERERRLLVKIDETLRKLDEHDYGFCTNCGEEIGIRRLEARPTAALCIHCKTEQEAREL